ncbi:hypothetical protein B0J11DRAFT_519972 [Dendryphion nanum]|uniref:NmrA-like domain-containing protein n=1 Tax=Dendryphion nanum TaxID=256645 RepID=A0A9P9ED20_9PLEO|nr:hypothetical protein B0J11DRAFT_519972 [Dendryphion nanum]
MSRAIIVTGATGKQGGSTIDALLQANADFEILALTRNPSSASAQKLLKKSPRIKLISGNMEAPEEFFKQARKVTQSQIWGVFSVQLAIGDGQNSISEERQGKAVIDAALANNVKHFVYSSVDRGGPTVSPQTATKVPHFISKHHIEQHLFAKAKGSDMTYTVLRPVAFFDNLDKTFFGKGFTTAYAVYLTSGKKLQLIASSDIGYFASKSFLNPEADEWRNASLSLAGDELSFVEFKDIFERTTGEKLPMTFHFIARILCYFVKELGEMYKWFASDGFGADIGELRKINPGLKGLAAWIEKDSAWKKE